MRPKIVSGILAFYGFYYIWIAYSFGMPLFLLWTAACITGAAGLWLNRRWSRWLVYLVAVLTVAGIASNITLMALSGWPYDWPLQSLKVLVLPVLAIGLCSWISLVTYRHFRAAG